MTPRQHKLKRHLRNKDKAYVDQFCKNINRGYKDEPRVDPYVGMFEQAVRRGKTFMMNRMHDDMIKAGMKVINDDNGLIDTIRVDVPTWPYNK